MTRLGDVATYINGFAFAPDDWSENGLPIIRIQDLTGNSYQMNRYAGEYNPKYEVNRGDVLISWSASLGVYVWQGEKALLNQHIFKVVFDKCEVDKSFYVHQVAAILEKAASQAHGATMKHLTKPVFDALPFYLPDLPTQRRIADTLDKVSEGIEVCRKMLGELDLMVKAKFQEMFGNMETNPMGWKKSTIGQECFYIKDGPHKSPPYVDEGIPFISTRNIVNGDGIDWSTAKHISEADYIECIKKCKPEKGDILYSKGGTTGIAKLVETDQRFANWVHVAVLKFGNQLDGKFFECMLNMEYCYQQSQRLTKGIANRDFVLSAIAQVKIIVPPIDAQKRYTEFVTKVAKSKLTIQGILDRMETEKLALMQEYFG